MANYVDMRVLKARFLRRDRFSQLSNELEVMEKQLEDAQKAVEAAEEKRAKDLLAKTESEANLNDLLAGGVFLKVKSIEDAELVVKLKEWKEAKGETFNNRAEIAVDSGSVEVYKLLHGQHGILTCDASPSGPEEPLGHDQLQLENRTVTYVEMGKLKERLSKFKRLGELPNEIEVAEKQLADADKTVERAEEKCAKACDLKVQVEADLNGLLNDGTYLKVKDKKDADLVVELKKWKEAKGETFDNKVELDLLEDYLSAVALFRCHGINTRNATPPRPEDPLGHDHWRSKNR